MRFVVLSNDAFEEAAIIANLSKQGTHTWVPLEKASASVTHIVVHPDISGLSSKQRAGLSALKKKCMAEVVVSRDVCRSFGFDVVDRMAMAASLALSTHAPTEVVLKHHNSFRERRSQINVVEDEEAGEEDVNGRSMKSKVLCKSNGSGVGIKGKARELKSAMSGGGGDGGYSLEAVANVRPVCVQVRRPLRENPDPNASYLAPKHWIKMLPNDDEGTKAPWADDLAAAAAPGQHGRTRQSGRKSQRREAVFVYQEDSLTTRDKQEQVLALSLTRPKVGVTFQSTGRKVMRANAFSNIMRGVKAKVATSKLASTKFKARTKLTPFDSPEAFEQRLNALDAQFEEDLRLKALQPKEKTRTSRRTKEQSAPSAVAERLQGTTQRQPRESASSAFCFLDAITTAMKDHKVTAATTSKGGREKSGVPRVGTSGIARAPSGRGCSCGGGVGSGSSGAAVKAVKAAAAPLTAFQKRLQVMGINELHAAAVEAGAGSKQEVMLWAEVRGGVGPRAPLRKSAVPAPMSAPLVRHRATPSTPPSPSAEAAAPPSLSSYSSSWPARAVAGGGDRCACEQRDQSAAQRFVRPRSSQLASLGQLGQLGKAHNRQHHQSTSPSTACRWVGAGGSAKSSLGV